MWMKLSKHAYDIAASGPTPHASWFWRTTPITGYDTPLTAWSISVVGRPAWV